MSQNTPTFTPTATNTPTFTPSPTATDTPSPTATNTPSVTVTPVPTLTPWTQPTPTPKPPKTPHPSKPGGKAPSVNTLSVLLGTPTYRWHYEYDKLQRVTYACSDWTGAPPCAGDEFAYTYDGAGNLISFDKWSDGAVETVSYVYNGANQILCVDHNDNGSCEGQAEALYQYDAYGNLTDDNTSVYTYDAENRLLTVTAGTKETDYKYNGDGDRVEQVVKDNSVVTSDTTYVLDVATPLTMVLSETSNGSTLHFWQGLDGLATTTPSRSRISIENTAV